MAVLPNMLVPPVPNPEADPNRLMLAGKHKVEDVEDRPFLGNRVHCRGLSTLMLSQALLFSTDLNTQRAERFLIKGATLNYAAVASEMVQAVTTCGVQKPGENWSLSPRIRPHMWTMPCMPTHIIHK